MHCVELVDCAQFCPENPRLVRIQAFMRAKRIPGYLGEIKTFLSRIRKSEIEEEVALRY